MITKPYTASRHDSTVIEVYCNGTYCGLANGDSISTLERLERSLKRSNALCSALSEVMVCRAPAVPVAHAAVVAWLARYGEFPGVLWVDPNRGVLWSPTAWSMVMVVTKAKKLELVV